MDIFLAVLACLCLLIGLVGCIVPVLPGPPISYVGLLLMQWSGYGGFSGRFLAAFAVVVIVVTVIDFYLPVWMTKRFGGSRAAQIGSAIGLVAGIFILPPIGIILGPFLGALAGELIHDRNNSAGAFKAAFGSFAAFMLGTGLKLVVSGLMIFYAVKAFFA